MATKIFVNLPVKDLDKSVEFFTQLGFSFNPQFTDETAASMVIAEDIYAMLLTHAKFKEFTSKDIVDATKSTEVLTCLSYDNKEKVDELVDKAIQAGGTETRNPMDYGFMFGRSFNDLDGHIWEVIWMDPSAINKGDEKNNYGMVEVFKTDVRKRGHAKMLINQIHKKFCEYRANFDLDDCDKILRIQCQGGSLQSSLVIRLLRDFGFSAEVLPDLPSLIKKINNS